jgi:hypothetical protein
MPFNDRLCHDNCSIQLVNRIVEGKLLAAHLETGRDTPVYRETKFQKRLC